MNEWQHISVNPVAGALGADVEGVDLGLIGDDAFHEVHAALLKSGTQV
jgi:hypothetical protein